VSGWVLWLVLGDERWQRLDFKGDKVDVIAFNWVEMPFN